VLRGQADPILLDTYEAERIEVGRRTVARRDRALDLQVGPPISMRFARVELAKLMPRLMRLKWVRLLFFRTVSQLMVNYRKSSLSVGRAGRIAGGDRPACVEMSGDGDNFATLRLRAWQAHVYGQAENRLREALARQRLPLHEFHWNP